MASGSANACTKTGPRLAQLWFLFFFVVVGCAFGAQAGTASSSHNNWAVLVCTSRFWFNYRHVANTLSIYRSVKRLGIPDDNIILMLADDIACNPRNRRPASVIANAQSRLDIYGANIEVDYRGYDVTVENFIRVLTGRHDASVPNSKRLRTDHESRVLVYMAGHGGDGFLKFQDNEEIGSQDIADAFAQMAEERRYKELFFIVDTCQANTLYTEIRSPNVLACGSSNLGENSYSHHRDADIGVSVIDSFTHYVLQVLEEVQLGSNTTLTDVFSKLDPNLIHSTPGIRTDLLTRPFESILVTDFFGSVPNAKIYKVSDADRVFQLEPAQGDGEKDKSDATADDISVLRNQKDNDLSFFAILMQAMSKKHPKYDSPLRELSPPSFSRSVAHLAILVGVFSVFFIVLSF